MRSEPGALARAFLSEADGRLALAILLSLVVHSLLLTLPLRNGGDAAAPVGPLQVRFGSREPAKPQLRPAARAASQRAFVPSPPPAEAAAANPAAIEVPRPSPIPAVGGRPSWPGAQVPTMDAQAAFQAQRQHQMLLSSQMQMRAARAEYEKRLIASMGGLKLVGSCRIALTSAGSLDVRCANAEDAHTIDAAIKELGLAPPIPEAGNWLLVNLSPGAGDGPTQLSSERIDHEPDR